MQAWLLQARAWADDPCLAAAQMAQRPSNKRTAAAAHLGDLRLHPAVGQVREACVADHVACIASPGSGVPLVRQGQLRERLFVCTSASLLIMMSCTGASRRPAPGRPWRSDCPAAAAPGRCRRPRCCWTPAACSSAVLLMVSVLPVIPVAELSAPLNAQRAA